MPKVEISTSKGVVQSSGEGLHIIGGTLSDSVGIHTLQELVTIPAAGMTTQGDAESTGVVLKELPANSQVLNSTVTIIQKPTVGAQVTLSVRGAAAKAAAGAAVGGKDLSADFNIGTGGLDVGATVALGLTSVGSDTKLQVAHAAANNAAAVTGDAKILVTIVYAGKGEPVAIA